MTDFLLEIFSEEIPARMQKNARENFLQISKEALIKAGLLCSDSQIKTFISQRRLVLSIENLPDSQKSKEVRKVGPKTSADKKAVEGFLRANGLDSIDDLQIVEHNGSPCYLYSQAETSIKTLTIIKSVLPGILQKMANVWPKIMRYNIPANINYQAKWIRPIRNILCIFGEQIVDLEFAGLNSNNLTYGHFLYSDKPIQINNPQEYRNILRENFVIVDQDERKQKIIEQIQKIKSDLNLYLIDDEKSPLLDEVVGLCEYPTALTGEIDSQFMHLAPEILILTLKLNQKYFCLKLKDGNLSQKFIFISSAVNANKNAKKIIADNEKVVRARLNDAKFFVEEDLKTPLAKKTDDLKNIIFHKKLGSVHERLARIEDLAEVLSVWIPHCNIRLIEKASILCKADLTTKAVAELPELQGKIGSFYAKLQNENPEIVKAIYEHYLPLGPNSELPETPLGIALAIADKIDAIVGLFLADEKPTSSKDPYALRRQALGVIRIAFSYNLNLPLRVLIEKSLRLYKPKMLNNLLKEQNEDGMKKKLLTEEIITFFFERLKGFLKDNVDVRGDILNAVIDNYIANISERKYCDILLTTKKVLFIDSLVKSEDKVGIIQLYKRSANVLAIEEKKDKKNYSEGKLSVLFIKTKYDKTLDKIIKKIAPEFRKLILKGEFEKAFSLLRLLEAPLVQFFDHVVVNDKNSRIRQNRLIILAQIRKMFLDVADFSKIEI